MLAIASSSPAVAAPNSIAGVWDGTVGNQPIRVCFNERNWGTFGAYYYRTHLQAISLQQPDSKHGAFVEGFDENDAKAPHWSVRIAEAGALAGQWTQGSRTLPIKLARASGMTLKEDETPCGSMLFHGPRLAGVHVFSKAAVKDGVRYTRLILDHRGHFGEDLTLESFALSGNSVPVRAINERLRKPLAGGPDGWLSCIRAAWDSGPHSESYEMLSPRMITKQ